jgi:hypothetical protein
MGGDDHRLNNRLDPAYGQDQRAQSATPQRNLQNTSAIDCHLKIPPRARSMRQPQNICKISDCAVPLKPQPAKGRPGSAPAIRGSTRWPIVPIFSGYLVA